MKNWLIILGIVVIACSAPACKKLGMGGGDGDDKGYIVEGGGGIVPPNPSGSDCLKKGSLGVQGLLLKGECPKVPQPVTAPICGNNLLEKDEACDDGNTKDGDGCSATCKKEAGGGNKEGQVVPIVAGAPKIITESIGDGKLGEEYSATIYASGKAVSDDYVWTVGGLPSDKFETLSKLNYLKISNMEGADVFGHYVAKVKVCLKSDATKCASANFSFSITDQLVMKAFHMDATSQEPQCQSDGKKCNDFVFGTDESIFTEPKDSGDLKENALVVVRLHVHGSDKEDSSFKWQMTVDGKSVPVLTSDDIKKSGLPKGIFLYNPFPEYHYILFSPDMLGKTAEKVVVTATNDKFGKQSLSFDKISVPSENDFKNAQEATALATAQESEKVKQAALDKCSNFKIESIEVDKNVIKPTDAKNIVTFDINNSLGNKQSIKLNFSDKSQTHMVDYITLTTPKIILKTGKSVDMKWIKEVVKYDKGLLTVPSYDASIYSLTHNHLKDGQVDLSLIVGYTYPTELRDSIVFFYAASGCTAKVAKINRVAKYPDPLNLELSAINEVSVSMEVDDIDENSRVGYILHEKNTGHTVPFVTISSISLQNNWCGGKDDCKQTKNVSFSIDDKAKTFGDITMVTVTYRDPGIGSEMNIYPAYIFMSTKDYTYECALGSPNLETDADDEPDETAYFNLSCTPKVGLNFN